MVNDDRARGGQNEPVHDDYGPVADRLGRASRLLDQLARNAEAGEPPGAAALSAALSLVLNARNRVYGDQRPDLEGSARWRILVHLQRNEGEPVSADELSEISGIRAWERRVRELREQGYDIVYVGDGRYRLNAPG